MAKHLIVVLSDGSTYDLLPGASVLVVNDDGMQALTAANDARILEAKHIEAELDIAELLPDDVTL
jgi:hypothetical protein